MIHGLFFDDILLSLKEEVGVFKAGRLGEKVFVLKASQSHNNIVDVTSFSTDEIVTHEAKIALFLFGVFAASDNIVSLAEFVAGPN